jgi:hypothetical protein
MALISFAFNCRINRSSHLVTTILHFYREKFSSLALALKYVYLETIICIIQVNEMS